jgi:predicted Zn-ribbon and HTH transcriptional regulator
MLPLIAFYAYLLFPHVFPTPTPTQDTMPTNAKCPKCKSKHQGSLLDGSWCYGCTVSERTVAYCQHTNTPLSYLDPETKLIVSYKKKGQYLLLPPAICVPDGLSDSDKHTIIANIKLFRERKNELGKKYYKKKAEAAQVARCESNPAQNQPHATGAQKSRAVKDITQLLTGPSFDKECDVFCVNKVGLDPLCNPKNHEGIDQSTNRSRNPIFLARVDGPRGELGDVVHKSSMVPVGSKNDDGKGLVIEIVSCVTGEGSEQTALDCELAAQKAFENTRGRLWKVTGMGKSFGTDPGDFGVECVVYKGVISLIQQRILAFNSDQAPSTIDMIMKFYPWATKEFWVKPNYDDHRRKSQNESERYREKKAAAAAATAGTPLTSSDTNKNKRKAEVTDEDTKKKTNKSTTLLSFGFKNKKSD